MRGRHTPWVCYPAQHGQSPVEAECVDYGPARIWRDASLQPHAGRWQVPRAGRVRVHTIPYCTLFKKKKRQQIDNDMLRCRSFFLMGLRLTPQHQRGVRGGQARFHFLFHHLVIPCCGARSLVSLHILQVRQPVKEHTGPGGRETAVGTLVKCAAQTLA